MMTDIGSGYFQIAKDIDLYGEHLHKGQVIYVSGKETFEKLQVVKLDIFYDKNGCPVGEDGMLIHNRIWVAVDSEGSFSDKDWCEWVEHLSGTSTVATHRLQIVPVELFEKNPQIDSIVEKYQEESRALLHAPRCEKEKFWDWAFFGTLYMFLFSILFFWIPGDFNLGEKPLNTILIWALRLAARLGVTYLCYKKAWSKLDFFIKQRERKRRNLEMNSLIKLAMCDPEVNGGIAPVEPEIFKSDSDLSKDTLVIHRGGCSEAETIKKFLENFDDEEFNGLHLYRNRKEDKNNG